MRKLRGRPSGFTMIELMVSLLLAVILVAAAMALIQAQQRSLQNSSADRAMQDTARTALEDLTSNLRRAGFGIDPALAFDFSTDFSTYPPGPCAAPVVCRDRTDGPDEIVFYARDAEWRRQLTVAPTAALLTLKGPLRTPLEVGQILQVMCTGAGGVAYVTVSTRVPANWVPPPGAQPASTAVPLLAGTGAFPRQNAAIAVAGDCYQQDWSGVRVYRVERFRYFVQSYADETGQRPYLMLDRGLRDANGAQLEVVSPDVEDIQFEYVFQNPVTMATRSVGGTSGVPLANAATSIDLAAAPPVYDDRHDAASRTTNHPANIRAVRISVVARSPGLDITRARSVVSLNTSEGAVSPASANRGVLNNVAPYHLRIRMESTADTRNLESRVPYYEP